jgi:hypothetical protein
LAMEELFQGPPLARRKSLMCNSIASSLLSQGS